MRSTTLFIVFVLSLLANPLVSRAQNSGTPTCESTLVGISQNSDLNQRKNDLKKLLDVNLRAPCVVELLILPNASQATRLILWNIFKGSTENLQQAGATASGTSGSTNLISKNFTSHILSFASEYGAITESTSGQTTTAAGTLDGVPLALEGHTQGLFAECGANLVSGSTCLPSKWFNSLGRISYSVSLDSTPGSQLSGTTVGAPQGNAQEVNVNTTGTPIRVSQITVKVVLIQPPSTFDNFTKALQQLSQQKSSASTSPTASSSVTDPGKTLQEAQDTLIGYQNGAQNYTSWIDGATDSLVKAGPAQIVGEWRKLSSQLAAVLEQGGPDKKGPTDDQLMQAALTFASAFAGYAAAERMFYNTQQVPKPVLSLAYNLNRPSNQPSNSVFQLIYGQKIGAKWTLTGNAAVSIYNSAPSSSIPGASYLRDVQAGVEVDRDLGTLWLLGPATACGTYYFQYQSSPAILNVNPSQPNNGITITGLPSNATQIFAQKGSINVAQVKLALGSTKSNWKFPVAVSWSNRTELITKSTWRAQIGITYDFDSLLAGTSKSAQ
jgi:hypothetical protein